MNAKNQTFFVLGVSKSGCAVAEHVLAKGGKCYIFDQLDNEKVKTNKDIDVRKLQIPMEVIQSSYDFFDDKVSEYNRNISLTDYFVKE